MTSNGSWMIFSPFKENITKMVNSKATGVKTEIRGMNLPKYHSSLFVFRKIALESKPPKKGIPKYINTVTAISAMETLTIAPLKPNNGGRMVMNT